MDPTRFDTLTKSLGQARSRRTLLRALGGAALGALGFAGASRADAAKGGTSAAAAFCAAVFGDTRAAGQCTSQAAHGTGPYVACQGDPANYCAGVCCASDQVCQRGACVAKSFCATHPNGTACGTGGACLDGNCFLVYPNCNGGSYAVAANGGGVNACLCGDYDSGSRASCTTTSDCPNAGEVCFAYAPGFICNPGCPA